MKCTQNTAPALKRGGARDGQGKKTAPKTLNEGLAVLLFYDYQLLQCHRTRPSALK